MAYIYYEVARGKIKSPDPHAFSLKRASKSFVSNIFVIILPILLLWSIVSGLATPTETGVTGIFSSRRALVGSSHCSSSMILIISEFISINRDGNQRPSISPTMPPARSVG